VIVWCAASTPAPPGSGFVATTLPGWWPTEAQLQPRPWRSAAGHRNPDRHLPSQQTDAAQAPTVTPSSGRTVRHRLNRGGDRALNRAIHTIAMTRTRCCPTTRTYIARRTAEGKTPKEIRRCLKRYIARALYRTLTATITPTDHPGIAS
jgi:hypothetical protein